MAAAQPINTRGLREKINLNSLALNTPHALTLEGDGGIETPGTWGTQYRYNWDGNRISFVDPVVHEMIQAQGARSGDSIKFWRLETRNGSRKGPIQYRIELVNTADGGDDGTGIPNIPPTAREARAQAATAKATPPAWVSEARALAQQAEPVATPAPLVSAPQTLPRVEQAAVATTSVTDTQRREQATARETARLSAAAVAAIDAANTAESYAEAHGRRVAFTSEDLRAMTLSVYITLCGSQR
jgi:hypothetical protein